MKMNKIAASLAFVAVALSGTASAATYTVGALGTTPYVNFVQTAGSFSDTYNFTIGALSDAAASATNHQLTWGPFQILDITNFNMSIYNSANTLLSSSGSGVSVFSVVAADSYHAVVSGTSTGVSGGAYVVSMMATPQPVPVPAAVWLLGSGLIGLVGVARRKEQA